MINYILSALKFLRDSLTGLRFKKVQSMTNLELLTNNIRKNGHVVNLALGDFILTKTPIGQGGNGIVYEAKINEKIVAIKFLVSDATGKTKDNKIVRFNAEYFNIVSIEKATNIVRYLDYDNYKVIENSKEIVFPVIIMNRYKNSLTKEQKSKSENGFLNLIKFFISTLKQIHNSGIIHRDIKPENILIDGKGEFYLADFGIASYNPDFFAIVAETEKKERLGNRLFSAPEQEQSGVEANRTMDIYAIGQVLQWYALGFTHRGTGRQKITTVFPELSLYDRIIEKCLEQNPNNRFQSIEDIEEYIKNGRQKNIFQYLHLFHRICTSSFPKNDVKIIHTEEKDRIDRFLMNLKKQENEFDDNLWWVDGMGSFEFNLTFKKSGVWKFDISEYEITDLWMHYDSSVYNDFVLIKFKPGEPFIINGSESFDTAIVDGEHHISYSEHESGYAEIDNDIIDLANHDVESIARQANEGYFFIGVRGHCIIEWKNEEYISDFIENCNHQKPTLDELRHFEKKIRLHKNDEVKRNL